MVADPAIGTANRFDAGPSCRPVELDPSEQIAEIGHCDCRLLVGSRSRYKFLVPNNGVNHRVLGMDPQMNELRHELGVCFRRGDGRLRLRVIRHRPGRLSLFEDGLLFYLSAAHHRPVFRPGGPMPPMPAARRINDRFRHPRPAGFVPAARYQLAPSDRGKSRAG